MSINIAGLDRDILLQALWENSAPASFFMFSIMAPPAFDIVRAKQELHRNGYADYICGRVIKADIYSSDTVDPKMYDRDIGQGAFQKVVDKLRAK